MDGSPFTKRLRRFWWESKWNSTFRVASVAKWEIRELKQQRRRRLRKRHLKREFARAVSNFIAVILSRFSRGAKTEK